MMPARWQARPATSGPFIRSAVQISFTFCASKRPYACGGRPPGRVVAGLEPPLDRPLGRRPAQLGGQHPPDLRGGAGWVLSLRPAGTATCGSVRGVHCRGAGTSASNPPARRAVIPPVDRLA